MTGAEGARRLMYQLLYQSIASGVQAKGPQ